MDNSVFVARCESYQGELVGRQIERIFEWAGGVESLLQNGKRVLLKPNLLLARAPEGATTAHPEVVCAVAAALVRAGADVTIADSPGGVYNARALERVYSQCRMDDAARRAGARLNMNFSSKSIKYSGHSFDIITPALEADVIISVAKLKTHMLTYYTGAVKNMFGTVAGTSKAAMHARYPRSMRFCEMLVDLCQSRTPVFSIIDGIQGMEGDGPSAGQVREAGVLIASRNPFAADLAAMDAVGLSASRSLVHRCAAGRGLVAESARGLAMCGDVPFRLDPPFVPAGRTKKRSGISTIIARVTNGRTPYPVFGDKCVGCGDCAAICPGKAIAIVDRRAVLKRKNCIRCYCCHELCPIKAVNTRKGGR